MLTVPVVQSMCAGFPVIVFLKTLENTMTQTATIIFVDANTNEEGCIMVRCDDRVVGLAVSLKCDGDIEVFLTKQDAEKLSMAIERAIELN